MAKQHKTFSLTCEDRAALEAICRRHKVDALVWKRARAFLLPDAGYDAKLVCGILDIGSTVLTEWRFAFSGAGLSFLGLKDYGQRQGHSSVTQEQGLKARFTEHPARNVDEICACILTEYGQIYSIRLDQGEFCDHSRSALISELRFRFFDAGQSATFQSGLSVARVGKPDQEEAAWSGCALWGKREASPAKIGP